MFGSFCSKQSKHMRSCTPRSLDCGFGIRQPAVSEIESAAAAGEQEGEEEQEDVKIYLTDGKK